jgi:hypothetical protein
MKLSKLSNYIGFKGKDNQGIQEYVRQLDNDIRKLFLMTQGRVRFGGGTDGQPGENVSGEFQVYTSNGSANTEDTIAHTLGAVPIGYIVVKQDKASNVYLGSTAWTSTNVYLKQSGTSVATTIFLLK